MVDFQALAAQLLASADTLVPAWFPQGRRHGHEWCVGSIHGEPGESLKINLRTGRWADFADPDVSGGDLISLYARQRGMKQLDAARELGGEPDRPLNGRHYPAPPPAPAAPRAPETVDAPLVRPPVDAPEPSLDHYKWGLPTAAYAYRDADGILGYVARYEPDGERKQFAPWTWIGGRWQAKAFPKPRPLYGLERLAAAPGDAKVLLVEGEKCADAIRGMVAPWVVMSWPGGARAIGTVDWSPLAGRQVMLWPDADEPGRECMAKVCETLIGLGCSGRTIIPDGQPEGWDAADVIAEGWTREQLRAWFARDGGRFVVSYSPSTAGGAGGAQPSLPSGQSVPATTLPSESPAPPEATTAAERRAAELDIRQRWEMMGLDTRATSNGVPPCNEDSALRVLGHNAAPFYHDEFLNRDMVTEPDGAVRQVRDSDALEFLIYMQRDLQLHKMSLGAARAGLEIYTSRVRRNSAQEWMRALQWDGVERLHSVMPTGFDTADDAYHRAVGRCFFMSMVARILEPGCKCDYMPVFEGGQGIGKTSALEAIGGDWYAENHEEFGSKDFMQSLQGKMLVEISELAGFNRSDQERIKGVITTRTDRYRASYGRVAVDHPRTCVFVGTTNRDDWIRDDTGARRFWRVRTGDVKVQWFRDNREQLFAEAVTRYTRGESYWDVDRSEAERAAEGARDLDAWHDMVSNWLANRSETRPDEAFEYLGIDVSKRDRANMNRLLSIFRANHWESVVTKHSGVSVRVWRPTAKSPGRTGRKPASAPRLDAPGDPEIPF